MEERRKSIRIRKPLLLRFVEKDGKTQLLSISNLNQRGLCFLGPIGFTQGECIDVSLKLPSRPNEWHECRLKILESKDITKYPGAFVSGFRTRTEFDSISELSATFLKAYCDFVAKQNQKLERTFQELLGVLERDMEKRGNIRIPKALATMYTDSEESVPLNWDITTIRNISTSGAAFTTKTNYKKFTHLQLLIKIPLKPFDWTGFSGKVIESERLEKSDNFVIGGTYLIRIEFLPVPMGNRELLEEYVGWFVGHLRKEVDNRIPE